MATNTVDAWRENLELRLRRVNEALRHPRSKESKLVLLDFKAKLEKKLEDGCSDQLAS